MKLVGLKRRRAQDHPSTGDNKDDYIVDENRVENALVKYTDQLVEVQEKEQVAIKVEERMPEGDHKEETISIIEDEFQNIPPPTLV